eukprot:CAMPEP_0185395060 /NCGR_PEP_ID=MMETSP1364-20130426/81916_1 /TAXON_ID=38817 /ORGANISM="Gephyrocapsa oceanica, Strain RCC1303" /LENGTH=39 /DNA_ID= /DNA_START= /DNA_END= /DNA_ORIENTATION=
MKAAMTAHATNIASPMSSTLNGSSNQRNDVSTVALAASA